MAEYIERESAMLLPELPKEYRNYQTDNLDDAYEQGWYDALCCLEHIPAADVAPVVHGRWIDRGDYVTTAYGSLPVNMCSECHMDVTLEDFDSYCPNCGARMDGDSDAKAD